MSGENELRTLLATLHPQRQPGTFVFVVVHNEVDLDGAHPVVTVTEAEGLTAVLAQEQADALGLAYDYVAAWLTLQVHSALDAIGLTAAVSSRLAEAGISCNVVAGYHHDHLFVPANRADDALKALAELSLDASNWGS